MLKDEAVKYLGCSLRTLNRMVKSGILNPTGIGKNQLFPKKELQLAMTDLVKRQSKHTPKSTKEKEEDIPDRHTPPPPSEFEEEPKPEALLNEIGQSELLRVTKSLRDADLLEVTDPMLIMKYALFQQLFIKYLHLSEKDPFYTKTMEIYQKHVSFYEKELGLTTAARLKLKPPKPEPEKDPFEEMMND